MQPKEKREVITFNNDYEVNIANENSPTSFPAHWHVFTEFVLATKDHCNYAINGKPYEINAGDLLLIWPTEMHEVVSTPMHASLILQFDSAIISRCRDINMNRYSLQSHHHIKASEQAELASSLRKCMQKCCDIYYSGEPFVETKIKIQIHEMLTILATDALNKINNSLTSPESINSSFLKINNACTYITENCEKDLTQEEVADYVGFSRYHFARLFKEYTSATFVHYLTKQRLQKAIELLGDRNLSITSIAYQSGFQSISNFNRVFKEVKGCSPKEYRTLYYYNISAISEQIT